MLKRLKNKKGFTLVELLAVIVVLAIIALIGYSVVGDVISGAQESADKENVREYARSVRLAITSAQMNGQTVSSELDRNWLNDNVKKTGAEVNCNSVIDNNGTITLSGCSVGGSVQEYCYDGTNITTCTKGTISRIYGTDAGFGTKTNNLFNIDKVQSNIKTNYFIKNNGDSTLTVDTDPAQTLMAGSGDNLLQDYAPELEGGKIYILKAKTTNTANYIHLADSVEGDKFTWFFGEEREITQDNLNNKVYWYTTGKKEDASATISEIQIIEVVDGTDDSIYEPYGYKIPINATKEEETPVTITVYIGSDPLGANDYIEYKDSKWYVVRDGSSMEAPMVKGEVPTGKVTYSVTGLDDSNFVYNYE